MSGYLDIEREYAAAARALTDSQRDRLIAAGVDRIDITLGMVGVARGRLGKFDLFEPEPHGALTYLCPVRVDPCRPLNIETPVFEAAIRYGDLIDLVAWHPDHPAQWALRFGNADCLGLVQPQYLYPDPVRIHRGPLGWLRGGCRGMVLLTHNPREQYRLLAACRSIVAEDDAHRRALRAFLAQALPLPPIEVNEQEIAHVA